MQYGVVSVITTERETFTRGQMMGPDDTTAITAKATQRETATLKGNGSHFIIQSGLQGKEIYLRKNLKLEETE